jgi:hypothetical protein
MCAGISLGPPGSSKGERSHVNTAKLAADLAAADGPGLTTAALSLAYLAAAKHLQQQLIDTPGLLGAAVLRLQAVDLPATSRTILAQLHAGRPPEQPDAVTSLLTALGQLSGSHEAVAGWLRGEAQPGAPFLGPPPEGLLVFADGLLRHGVRWGGLGLTTQAPPSPHASHVAQFSTRRVEGSGWPCCMRQRPRTRATPGALGAQQGGRSRGHGSGAAQPHASHAHQYGRVMYGLSRVALARGRLRRRSLVADGHGAAAARAGGRAGRAATTGAAGVGGGAGCTSGGAGHGAAGGG